MKIARVILLYRTAENMGVRDVARETGISSATISRIENGGAVDGDTLLKLLQWLFKEEEKKCST